MLFTSSIQILRHVSVLMTFFCLEPFSIPLFNFCYCTPFFSLRRLRVTLIFTPSTDFLFETGRDDQMLIST